MLQKTSLRAGAAAAALLIALSLTACAPEPEEAEFHGKNPIESGEAEYPEPPPEAFDKNIELPESFPAAFPLPEGLVIDDTGEAEPGRWFIVFTAADQASADASWQSVIEAGGFTVSDSVETTEGGVSATLSSSELAVIGTTIPNTEDGTVLLSYDISAITVVTQ